MENILTILFISAVSFMVLYFIIKAAVRNGIIEARHYIKYPEDDDDNDNKEERERKCPECGEKHDIDFPKCPHCNHAYFTEK